MLSRGKTALDHRLWSAPALIVLFIALTAIAAPSSAVAEVQYGTLSNFDVPNDTGEETHGFQIELDDVHSSDISYEFGAPYERYGNPKLIDFPGGVYVRYESPYYPASKAFTQGTPIAASPIMPTLGHQCWTGGSVEYLTSGCEHFGVGLIRNPTKTVYRWLTADPAKPGNLIAAGMNVSLPAPEWSLQPPSPENPQPVVRAVVNAPEPHFQAFGEAEWVKVYVTESPQPAQLNHLLSDDPAVPQEESHTETEWVLLQKSAGAPNSGELASERPMGAGQESVTRRYEIYRYNGAYNPEDHEAEPAIDDNTPAEGEVGEYVGAQMAALNIEGGEPAPTIKRLSVKTGPAAGGTTLTITGTGLAGATAVRFGSVDAASFKVNSATSITAQSPAGTAGIVDVTVTTPNGSNGLFASDHFKYGNPTVTGVSPASGAKAGGTSVTITGSGFALGAGVTTLKFGSKLAASVECASSTSCIAVTPPGAKVGAVDVRATVAKKSSAETAADRYSYS